MIVNDCYMESEMTAQVKANTASELDIERNIGCFQIDRNRRVVSGQGALFSVTSAKLPKPGDDIADFLFKITGSDISPYIDAAIKKAKSTKKEFELKDVHGKSHWISVFIEPRVGGQRITGATVSAKNITMENYLSRHAELRAKMEQLGVLATHIADRINNPLAAVLNQLGCLLMEDFGPEDVPRVVQELTAIQEKIYSVSLITNALNSFTDRSHLGLKYVGINSVIDKSIALCKLLYPHTPVDYKIEFSQYLPRILGNDIALEQCFINLIKNAIEAMPKGGILTVHTAVDSNQKDYIRVTIQDNGQGMENDHLNSIYEPFFKAKKGDHLGLGLSISFSIVMNHIGHMEIESEKGRGTKVSVLLPVVKIPTKRG